MLARKIFATLCLILLLVSPVNVFAVVQNDTSDETAGVIETVETPLGDAVEEVTTEEAPNDVNDETTASNEGEGDEETEDITVANDSTTFSEDTEKGSEEEINVEVADVTTEELLEDQSIIEESIINSSTEESIIEEAVEEKLTRSPSLAEDLKTASYDGVIVKYKDKKSLDVIVDRKNKDRKKSAVLKVKEDAEGLGVALVTSQDNDAAQMIEDLENEEGVEFVEPNYSRTFSFIPNDAFFSAQQWSHRNIGQNINGVVGVKDADIDGDLAWDQESATGSEVIVAVIDTGVNYAHADLDGNMWDGSAGCFNDLGVAIDPPYCPNHGWDYADDDNNPDDADGHGTFVASLIASETNNGAGISGMSRYDNLKIMAIRFDFDLFSEIQAIDFATNNGAKVINASFGGPGFSAMEKAAIDAFPGVFVAAAGNGGADGIGDNMDSTPEYPCAYTSANLLCVAASDQNDQLAKFSNYGPHNVDLAAPGVNIIGLYKDDYFYGNGTSFSAPFVAATAGLLYGDDVGATIGSIRHNLLTYSNKIIVTNGKNISGNRRLNTYGALAKKIPAQSRPLYRFFHKQKGVHFYTISVTERDDLIKNQSHAWRYAGPKFYAYETQIAGTKPLYRFFHKQKGVHFYTISVTERDDLIKNQSHAWRYAGPKFYAYE